MFTSIIILTFCLGGASSYTFDYNDSEFAATLESEHKDGDVYQIITGDSQIPFGCTSSNKACKKATCKDGSEPACIAEKSKFSNTAQVTSMLALAEEIEDITGETVAGIVMNGDITQSSTEENVKQFNEWWVDEIADAGLQLYAGIGNHDVASMSPLNWLYEFIMEHETEMGITNKDVEDSTAGKTGSLAYSWDVTSSSGQVYHFVQLQYYPFYNKQLTFDNGTTWDITSAMDWFKQDLIDNAGKPVIVNFHSPSPNYRTGLPGSALMEDCGGSLAPKWLEFQESLAGGDVQGVFFAHWHTETGVAKTSCIGDNTINFMYSGSVPGGNYVLIRLRDGKMNNVYNIHVDGFEGATILDEDISADVC